MLMPFADMTSIIAGRPTVYPNVPATTLRHVLEEHGDIVLGQIPELTTTLTDVDTDYVDTEEDSAAVVTAVTTAVRVDHTNIVETESAPASTVSAEIVQVEEITVDENECQWTETASCPSHLDDKTDDE